MSKSPKYWVTLIYKLFLTYDEVTSEYQSDASASRVRANVPSAKIDESEVEREAPQRRVSHRRARLSKRI
jgi:hypothetical protein